MKKRTIFLSSLLLLALCASGCGVNTASHKSQSSKDETTSKIDETSKDQSSNNDHSSDQSTSTSVAHVHNWGSWNQVKAATCTEAGSEQKTCSGCGQVETNAINALGHNWDNGIITIPATEGVAGEKTYTCSRCKTTKTETIPALPKIESAVLSDVAEANMQINFSNIEDNCMVAPRVKTYVDAMEAQELTLDRPYHFSSLYGPDDYAKIAAASDKGDGTTYAAEDTGGVDVCQILTRSNGDAKNHPIVLKWNNGSNTFSSAKLKFWSTEDRSDLREVNLSANATSASLANLYRARKYRAQLITNDGKASQGFEFTTGGPKAA